MNNEIRNELLCILAMMKRNTNDENEKDQQECDLHQLLQRFEYDIKDKLRRLQYEKEDLENNLKTLEYVRKELGVE